MTEMSATITSESNNFINRVMTKKFFMLLAANLSLFSLILLFANNIGANIMSHPKISAAIFIPCYILLLVNSFYEKVGYKVLRSLLYAIFYGLLFTPFVYLSKEHHSLFHISIVLFLLFVGPSIMLTVGHSFIKKPFFSTSAIFPFFFGYVLVFTCVFTMFLHISIFSTLLFLVIPVAQLIYIPVLINNAEKDIENKITPQLLIHRFHSFLTLSWLYLFLMMV